MTDARMKARKVRLPKLNRIEKLTRGLLSKRDVNSIFTVKEIKGKGRGVFLRSAVLRKDSFVLEYEGDIISEADAQLREKIYENNNEGCYIMSFSFQGVKLAIDATRKFHSLGRLLNHSREPNARFHPPFVIDLKGGLPRIASYALRDIYKGEEIVIDYGVRDGHITWLRNREIGYRSDVDADSSDDSDCASINDSHTGSRTSERPSSPENYASCSSERPTSAAANSHETTCKQISKDPDNMPFSRGEWGARFTRLVPGSRINSFFAGFENIEAPKKILKCLEVTSEKRSQQSDIASVVCLSTSSSGSSGSVRSSSSSRKNTLSKHSSENVDTPLSIELPSDEALDSIHKVLEWQKTSPLPNSSLNIQIVSIQSLSDATYVDQNKHVKHSSSPRQQINSLKTQEIPASSHPIHPSHGSQPDANLHGHNQSNYPSDALNAHLSSSPPKHMDVSVVTVDTSDSDTCESSSLSSFSIKFLTPRKRPNSETEEERRVTAESTEVCIVSDDECVPETPVSGLELQTAGNASIQEIICDDDDSSSSECEIVSTESPTSSAGTAGCVRNFLGKRKIRFSPPSAQPQVAVIKPYVGPSLQGRSNKEVVMTDSEVEQLRHIFNKHIISNNASPIEITQAIDANWNVFSVLIQRGITLTQIRHIFDSFRKPNR